MALSSGQILTNRYRIVKLLGQGGFGAVYRVWDINLDRPLALKENLDISPEAQRQFKREAQILFDLSHPNLPRVIDHFVIAGQGQYLVMEYIEGEDLQQMVDHITGPLPETDVLTWAGQICEALAYLHGQTPAIIHRDIKPANIKITPAAGPNSPAKAVLVDFGIAKVHDPSMVTTVGARAVTPGFSPPEQYGQGATDARSDIYSLGATCYLLLSGQKPPASVDMMNLRGNPLRPLSSLNPHLSPATCAAIEKAMQLAAGSRFSTMSEFKIALGGRDLTRIGKPVDQTAKVVGPARFGNLPKSYLLYALAGVFALAVLLFGVNKLWRLLTSMSLQTSNPVIATETFAPTISSATSVVDRATIEPAATETSGPSLEPGAARRSQVDGMEMIYIPSGEFMMGSTDVEAGLNFDQTPKRQIFLNAYWIDRFEVSNGMYQKCVEAGACRAPVTSASSTRKYYYGNPDYADYPVVWITWDDASAYCQWAGRRLPSEAEWERAARGDNGRSNYPWGSAAPTGETANFCDANCSFDWAESATDDGFAGTSPIDFFDAGASIYNLLNMAGNAWEWVFDFYDKDYYRISPMENPFGPQMGNERVLRGGSFESSAQDIRSANRFYFGQDAATSSFGFRCAADIR